MGSGALPPIRLRAKVYLAQDGGTLRFAAHISTMLVIVEWLLYLAEAARLSCPICFGKVFGGARCSRHSGSKRLFGSTRLALAVSAVFVPKQADCRFCGTRLPLVPLGPLGRGLADNRPKRREPVAHHGGEQAEAASQQVCNQSAPLRA